MKLNVNPDNPRKIGDKEFSKLKNSILSFTKMLKMRPIAYDENKVIWGGNMRYLALDQLIQEGVVEDNPEYYKELIDYTLEEKMQFAIRDNIEFGAWVGTILKEKWGNLPLDAWGLDMAKWDSKDDEIESEPIKDFKDIKILNLYAGIGGNRKLWGDLNVTAVEYNEQIADVYREYFPNDEIIVGDAHSYLENNFDKYDFIWSSPPCPTHSRMRKNMAVGSGAKPKYPDMKLYEEILFLQGYFKGKWVVENVRSWYDPLIKPYENGRHYYWSNFEIPDSKVFSQKEIELFDENIYGKEKWGFDLSKYKFSSDYNHKKILNNMVHPEIGKFILEHAYRNKEICFDKKTALVGLV